jgi:hypothetical protein
MTILSSPNKPKSDGLDCGHTSHRVRVAAIDVGFGKQGRTEGLGHLRAFPTLQRGTAKGGLLPLNFGSQVTADVDTGH